MKIEKIQKLKEHFDQHAQWWDDMHTVEIWKARDLMELLGYDQWRNFESAIKRAMEACKNAGVETSLLFQTSTGTAVIGKGWNSTGAIPCMAYFKKSSHPLISTLRKIRKVCDAEYTVSPSHTVMAA